MEQANAIQKKEATPLQRFNMVIANTKTQDYLRSVLANKKDAFVNNITALVANDAKLQECAPMSLIYAGIKATALDLPLDNNLGFAYVIPYRNNKTGVTEAQLQLGYRAFIQLAIRSGQFLTINVRDVRAGEIIDEDFISGEMKFKRLEKNREQAPVIGYVAFIALTNGFRKMRYMTIEEVKAHAGRYSQTFASKNDHIRNSSKWTTDFDAMAQKTVLKLLLGKYAPLSTQIQEARVYDQATFNEAGEPEYVDNQFDTDEYKEAAVEDKKEAMRAQIAEGTASQPEKLL